MAVKNMSSLYDANKRLKKEEEEEKKKAAAVAKANKEKDLIGSKDAKKLTTYKADITPAKSLSERQEKNLQNIETAKESRTAAAESYKTEQNKKAAQQAAARKKADLPGYKPQPTITDEQLWKMLGLDVKKEEEQLKNKQQEYYAGGGTVAAVRRGTNAGKNKPVNVDFSESKALKKEIDDKEAEINLAKQIQQQAEYANILNSDENKILGGAGYQMWSNAQKAAKAEEKKQSVFDEIVSASFNAPDTTNPAAGIQQAANVYREDTSENKPNENWTNDQKNIFGYYWYKGDYAKAAEYARSVNNEINAGKKEEALDEAVGTLMRGNRTAADIASIPLGILSGADYLDKLVQMQAQGYYTENSLPSLEELRTGYRGARGEQLNIDYGTLGENAGILEGKGLGDLYNIGMSSADSLTSAVVGGKALALMTAFGGSASAATNEALARGADLDMALGYGTLAGAAELLPESLSVDTLLNLGGSNSVRGLLKNVGKQMASEGIEGAITAVSTAFADEAIMQELSKFNTEVNNLMLAGYSREDAEAIAAENGRIDIILDAVSEAIGGGMSGAAMTGFNNMTGAKKNEIPQLFNGNPQTEEQRMVFEKTEEIKNSSLSDAEKAVKLAEIEKAVAETEGLNTPEELATEIEKVKAVYEQNANAKQSQLDKAVETANRLGNVVEFDENIIGNGIHKEDGTIIINPNSKNPVMQILVHELTHDIETSGLYGEFSQKILDYAAEVQGVNLAKMEQMVINDYAKAGQKLDRNLADREIVAKFAEEHLFTDEKAIERLCNTDPTLFDRIRYWISDMVIKFRGTEEERFLRNAERLYEKALATRRETQGAGIEQRSIRKEFDNEISEWLNNTTPSQRLASPGYFKIGTTSDVLKSIGVKDGNIYWRKYKIGAILQDHPEMSEETIKKVPQILEEPYIIMKSATRADSIVLFGELRAENGNNVMAALLLTPQASGNKIEAEFSLLTSAHGNRDNKNIANLVNNSEILFLDTNKNRAKTWLMQLGVQFPSRQPANSSIGSIFYQDGEVNIKGKKLSEITGIANTTSNQHSVGRGFDELVADSNGNELSLEQMEYFKDSKIRDEDGNLLVVYHGTEENFTVFDRTKSRANMDIQGNFFSPWKDDAAAYGGKVGAYYLNIKNPAPEQTAYKALRMFQGQNGAGIKAREYLEKLGYDGVNNEDQEYIAFYPEQIKRIDNFNPTEDPDIRYSYGRGYDEMAKEAFEKGEAESISAEVAKSSQNVAKYMAEYEKNKPEKQSSTSQVNPEPEESKLADIPQSKKTQKIERRFQRQVEDRIADVFGVSRNDLKGDIRPIIEEITAELKNGNSITDEQIDKLYQTAFADGIITEEFPQYETARKYIRQTPIYVDKVTQDEFGDTYAFRDFARRNFGSIKISSDIRSSHLDSFYKTLTELVPDFFHEGETDPKTQLEDIADFMQQTKKQYYGLSEVFGGENLKDFEAWAKKELREYMVEFGKGIDTVRRYERDRQIKATNKAREIDRNASFDEAKAAFADNKIFIAKRNMENVKAKHALDDDDLDTVKRMLSGTINEADVIYKGAGNVEGIIEVYNAEKAYKQARAPFDRYKAAYKTSLEADAIANTSFSDSWKDKAIGLEYSRETAERNIKDITKNGKFGGKEIIREYIEPIHEHEAMKNRWLSEMNRRAKEIGFGRMNKYERAYTQMIGENYIYNTEGRITKHDAKEHDTLNENIEFILSEHGEKIDKAKCEKAAAGFMEIYKDILEQWNDERIRRGQEPVGDIEAYFPHFVEAKPENLIQKIFAMFGFEVGSSKLPTDIAGRTADRKPQSKYNPFANQRRTDITDYDVLKGFDRYIRAVGENIYHTEDIQKLRTLSDTIRIKYSGAEIDKRIEEIRNKKDLREEDKEVLIAEALKSAPGKYHLSNFVVWLDEYANIIAGKKSRGDREAEYQMGREIYDISKALEGRIASNMIGYNISTPIMNLVPLFQATADINPVDIISSVLQTGIAAVRKNNYISENSDFITNRFNVDTLYNQNYNLFSIENTKDFVSKISDGGGFLMNLVDRIVSESLVRARYNQNKKKGMGNVEAFADADQWAAGLIADRSLGALPTIFNIKNPVAKALTMFQVEANNQYSYIFKDAGKYKLDTEGAYNTIIGQLSFWAAMAICNSLAKELLGRDNVVPDPIGMTAKVLERLEKGEPTGEVIYDTAVDVVEQIPFVGGLLGGGRVPISTALPDAEQAAKLLNPEISGDKKAEIVFTEILKPLSYLLLPSGAGQLWKTGQGAAQIAKGGNYGIDNEGKEYLKYPQEQSLGEYVRAVFFGPYATSRGQQYIDSGFKDKLSAKQTEQMKLAEQQGMSKEEFYDIVLGLKGYGKKEEKQEALYNMDVSKKSKEIVDMILFGKPSYKAAEAGYVEPTRSYASKEQFYLSGLSESERRLAEDDYSYKAVKQVAEAMKNGTKGEQIDKIADTLDVEKTEAYEIYQKYKGNWINKEKELSSDDRARAQVAKEYYGLSTEEYIKVLNYSKFGAEVDGEYSDSKEDVVPNIADALNISIDEAEDLYNKVVRYDYTAADLEEDQAKELKTAGEWYEVEEKGYMIARNAIKDAKGAKDKWGNTVEGSAKNEAVLKISKQLNISPEEATIYYLAAKGELVFSKEDLSTAKINDLEIAKQNGWTEKQFLSAVNILKVSGASKKDEIIKALMDAGATYSMALGYYNLSKNYDYKKGNN